MQVKNTKDYMDDKDQSWLVAMADAHWYRVRSQFPRVMFSRAEFDQHRNK